MTKVAVLTAAFAAIVSAAMPAKIYTFGEATPAMPLAAVAAAGTISPSSNTILLVDSTSNGSETTKSGVKIADTMARVTPPSKAPSDEERLEREGNDDESDNSVDPDSDDEAKFESSSASVALSSIHAAFKLGSVLNATSTIEPTYPNWVGPALDTSITSACYRKTHIAKTCPSGFDKKLGICWTQCPYAYPVECGLECIRQNDDCGHAIFYKVAVVVQTALSLSSYGLYGDMAKWAKSIQLAVKCSKYMISLIKSLVRYIRYIKVRDPQTSQDQLLAILYQIDNVIIDIPVTIAYCIGKKASDDVKFVDSVLTTAEYALREIITYGDSIVSSWDSFAAFMKNITLGDTVSSLNSTNISSLKSALKSNSTCGYDMKRLLDRTWMTVAELRRLNPDISEDDIRVIMSQSNLVLNDIPIATNNCMGELLAESDEVTAYKARDTLRKTLGDIVGDLISSGTSNNGTFLSAKQYAFAVADRAIAFYAIWDPMYVSSVVSQFFQPICGPTELIGEIDDGSAKNALGMKTVQRAFNNSDGMWTKTGDGTVEITFKSVDTEDVTVNIKSGGDKIDEVDVPAGKRVTWTSNVTVLGGKTLYLDRWRPGFLGLPGTGGGSLLLWVPRSTQGGNLQLTAMLNVS
ncbi:unnamed protein product [Phytophthora lilii]|uniref:Unnamed protein product n=1 Tax=Phytophthora lilii TaxID=2077276 RepID=A0A9W7CSC6_9STRA|nr:unnamed protein product [Phytophthora lilii]